MIDLTVSAEELLARKAELADSVDGIETREALEEVKAEIVAINAELEERKNRASVKEEIRKEVASGEGSVIEERKEEKMENIEMRSTKEYLDAFVSAIKGDDKELRALVSANGSGSVAVPTYLEEKISTNWEKMGLLDKATKTYIKGNFGVSFEKSATGASVHDEGDEAPSEEELVLGTVTLIPQSVKKWITVTDEVLDLRGEAFIDYIFDELTYRIALEAQSIAVGAIASLPSAPTATSVSADVVSSAPSITAIAEAFAHLGDSAEEPVIIMNRLTYADFISAQADANFAQDPFYGLPVYYSSALDAYSNADEEEVYAIVGDPRAIHLNFPNGNDITVKMDDLSLAESDLVKFVGREYVGIGIVKDKAFALIAKPEA